MVKNLKKTLALMLSIIMIFSSTLMTYADDEGIIGSSEAGTSAQIEETVAAEAETQAEPPKAEATTEEKQVEAATETAAKADAEITAQPEDASVYANAEAEFAVETNSKVRSCQWQMAKSPSSDWSDLNRRQYGSSETLKIRALEKYNNWIFRCIVTFRDGSTEASDPATLHIVEKNTFPAQSFGSVKETKVVAPEGAFPAGTTMEASEVDDTTAVQSIIDDMKGVDGSVLNAVDITFYDGNTEIQPQETVKVTMNVGKDADFDSLTLVHIKANADELDKDGIKTEKVEFTANREAGTITFDADHFSTYSLVVDANNNKATIKWGYLDEDGAFVELEEGSTVTLDTTADTVSLDDSIEGYVYQDAVYCTEGQSIVQGIDIKSTLYKTDDDGWEGEAVNSEEGTTARTKIAANSTIYVTYFKPGTPSPSGAGDDKIPSPSTEKTVTYNNDGTYTIQLDTAGATVTEDNSHYANVLIILDATRSMNGSKWTNAKAAMRVLIETLTEGTNASNAGKIDFALVTFGRSATVEQGWTKDNTAFKTKCAGINMVSTSGTNWEAGMRGGLYGVLNTYPEGESAANHDPTYVIFLTDGDPNVYYSSGSATNYTNTGTTSGYNQNANTSASRSADEAKSIATNNKLYGIYCGDSGTTPSGESFNRLVSVITGQGQGGQKTIAANANTIQSEFKAIAETMLKEMGASNVAVDDGVPNLSSISANVTGEPGGYEYYKSTDGGETFSNWSGAPGATYNSENGVTWDLSQEGTVEEGTVYRIKFTVWPSQAAYDLIADLNNGKVQKTEAELKAAGIQKNDQGVYVLLTNTHLNTKYTFKDTDYIDEVTDYDKGSMQLPTRTIKAHKEWDNALDGRTAAPVTLIVTKDGTPYLNNPDITAVNSENNWTTKDIHVSMGFMTVKNGVANVKEHGHDYAIIEPENMAYYWELHSDVYHPMVINGTPTMLILDETATSADNVNTFEIDGKFYKKSNSTDNLIEATNKRRSNLNITKTVTGSGAPADAYFTYKVTVNDADGEDVWFSAQTNPDDPTTIVKDEVIATGSDVTRAKDDNDAYTGYYYAKSGSEITLKIKAGWNARFINLRTTTTYSIEETDMDPGFEFGSVAGSVDGEPGATSPTVDQANRKAEGTIDKPNTIYTATYSNNYLGCFYVYHSADNTVERHYLTEDAVTKDGTKYIFDIHARALTKENTYYGGYYYDYKGSVASGKTQEEAATIMAGLTYTNDIATDADGTAYTYDYIQTENRQVWSENKAGTKLGTEMEVQQNGVYYLKEVPTGYMQPYNHYTYEKATLILRNLWSITSIDDLNYSKAGFIIRTDDKDAIVVDTMTIRAENSSVTTTLNAGKVFAKKGVKAGYLGFCDITSYRGSDTTVVEYWDTLDGIRVYSTTERKLTFTNNKISGLRNTDTPYTPSGN